jgi:hypothetical protein
MLSVMAFMSVAVTFFAGKVPRNLNMPQLLMVVDGRKLGGGTR